MIKIERDAEPSILSLVGTSSTQESCAKVSANLAEFQSAANKLEFDPTIYGHSSVKQILQTMQHEKCCFCESQITHVAYGDVEHFRPKAAWHCQSEDKLKRPGYFWLAYTWSNLLFCCQICNQRYKRNFFPLVDESRRCVFPDMDITQEDPVFINPSDEEPSNHISFRGETAYALNNSPKGPSTIEGLQLNRRELLLRRSEKLTPLKLVHQVATGMIPASENSKQEAAGILTRNCGPKAEYSAAVKCAISDGFSYV